jgi:hypothetical protein
LNILDVRSLGEFLWKGREYRWGGAWRGDSTGKIAVIKICILLRIRILLNIYCKKEFLLDWG